MVVQKEGGKVSCNFLCSMVVVGKVSCKFPRWSVGGCCWGATSSSIPLNECKAAELNK